MQKIMKAIFLCYFIVALVLVSSEEEDELCGSETCSPGQDCEDGQCECTKRRCFILCHFGFKRDENGCEYPCTCAEDDGKCPSERCRIRCPFSFKVDKNGCEYPCICTEMLEQQE